MWLRTLCLAMAYWAVAQLSLLMAIPPGFATAFSPAAGLAVAMLLLWNNRAWAGVLLGSFLVNMSTRFDADTADELVYALSLPVIFAIGATVQAIVGATLVRRFVGFPNAMNREQDVAGLLLLAGPISCFISATLGVTSLWLMSDVLKQIQVSELLFVWRAWWAGDTIGVFVITPVILLWSDRTRLDWPRRPITVTIPLAVLAGVVVALFVHTETRERERLRSEFQFQTEILTKALDNRIDSVIQGLNRVHSFLGTTPSAADRDKFVKAAQKFLKLRPGVQALAWTPRVKADARQEFESAANFRIQQLEAGEMVPAGDRPEYYPILYREPALSKAMGFDVATEFDRLEALKRAGASGEPIASTPIPHLKEVDRKSMLVFLPIYRDNVIPVEDTDRQSAVIGYVIAIIRVDHLVDVSLGGFIGSGIDIWLFDDSAPPEKRFVYFRGAGRRANAYDLAWEASKTKVLVRTTTVESAGRRWRLQFGQTPEYHAAHRSLQAWVVLAGGMLCTGLLGAVLLAATGRAELVSELVEERTSELAHANYAMKQEIAERQRAQADLEEARRFVQRIAEMTPSILYVYDVQQKRNIFVNRRLESFLGYAWRDNQSPALPSLWNDVHPDDIPKAESALEQSQNAEDGEVIETEYRVRHVNGEWRWLSIRNTIFVRDDAGNPLQILGAAQDVTDHKRLQEQVLDIAASEQRRIGQELHDGTGQELTGLCMISDNLADNLDAVSRSEAQTARRIAQGLRQALGQVRLLSRGLIPVEVDAEGLMASLTELANRISELNGIQCVFECARAVPIEDNHTATQLYRIAQEAITNALKHGQARNLSVSLESRGHYITLKITDDGVGIAESNGDANEGMGLRIMHYRASQIGATFSVRPGATGGTVVTCTLVRGPQHDG